MKLYIVGSDFPDKNAIYYVMNDVKAAESVCNDDDDFYVIVELNMLIPSWDKVYPKRQKSEKECLVDDLKAHIVKVTFTKTDGTERVMVCTRKPFYIEQHLSRSNSRGKRQSNNDLISVWSFDDDAWRSFYLDSVIEYEVVT